MSRRGPMSIEDHRAWIAKFGEWTSPKRRPGERLVEHVMGQLAAALGRAETELVSDVIARVDYNILERARLELWARQALTVVVLAAERAGASGTQLSDNILFHELALRWSPAYAKALERGPGRSPSEMMRETLEATRDDIKNAGLRIQSLFDFATHGRRARRKKAEAGIASTAPPAGYVAERGGTWRKDPDDRVRAVIQLVFDKFAELRSCGPVQQYLTREGIDLPRRRERGIVKWSKPSRVRVHRILRNPAYAGTYTYGATSSDAGRQHKVALSDRVMF
jgi:hypothetical protein